jgi:DNA-binding XRE family transcriptional regulator
MTKSKTEEELRRAWDRRQKEKERWIAWSDEDFVRTMRKIMERDKINKTQVAAAIGVSRQAIHDVIDRVDERAERGET